MTKDVLLALPERTRLRRVRRCGTGCGSLPVIEPSARVIGMITDRDLFVALATQNQRAADLLVGEVMRRELSVCRPGDEVRQALKIMAKHRVHRLPVVDETGALQAFIDG